MPSENHYAIQIWNIWYSNVNTFPTNHWVSYQLKAPRPNIIRPMQNAQTEHLKRRKTKPEHQDRAFWGGSSRSGPMPSSGEHPTLEELLPPKQPKLKSRLPMGKHSPKTEPLKWKAQTSIVLFLFVLLFVLFFFVVAHPIKKQQQQQTN